MEISNSNNTKTVFVGDSARGTQNPFNRDSDLAQDEKIGFGDATTVDITDPNAKRGDTRELAEETQQYLVSKGIDIASESANFDKQSVLAQAGSLVGAHGHANVVNARELLS